MRGCPNRLLVTKILHSGSPEKTVDKSRGPKIVTVFGKGSKFVAARIGISGLDARGNFARGKILLAIEFPGAHFPRARSRCV